MAKLKHLAALVEKMNGGDAARSNSLIMVARKEGLFTTGGRGPHAPEMQPRDFGRALLLGATLAPPTRAAEAVRALESAQINVVSYDPLDGEGMRPVSLDEMTSLDAYGFPLLPNFLPEPPHTLGDFLESLFTAIFRGEWSFQDSGWLSDDLSISDKYGASTVGFSLSGTRHSEGGTSLFREIPDDRRTQDHYGWLFGFKVKKAAANHEFFGELNRVIHVNALQAFEKLARGDVTDA